MPTPPRTPHAIKHRQHRKEKHLKEALSCSDIATTPCAALQRHARIACHHRCHRTPRAHLKQTAKLFTSARAFFDPIRVTAQTFDRSGPTRSRLAFAVERRRTSAGIPVRHAVGASAQTRSPARIGTEPIDMSQPSRPPPSARALQSSRTTNAIGARPTRGQKKTAAPGGRSSAETTISDLRFPAARRSRPDRAGR